jgi:hypothetical protein
MIGRNFKVILVLSILFSLASCGYHFSGEGAGPKPGLTCIAIPVFENDTSEPNLGAMFAAALRQEFMRKGTMKVVSVDEAEAVFKGTVKRIHIWGVAHYPGAIVSNRNTLENRLYVTLDIRCEDKKTHKILWRDANFEYHKVYQMGTDLTGTDPLRGYENRQDALQFLAVEMSRRIHDRFLSNF